jgi:hypothetical protein
MKIILDIVAKCRLADCRGTIKNRIHKILALSRSPFLQENVQIFFLLQTLKGL